MSSLFSRACPCRRDSTASPRRSTVCSVPRKPCPGGCMFHRRAQVFQTLSRNDHHKGLRLSVLRTSWMCRKGLRFQRQGNQKTLNKPSNANTKYSKSLKIFKKIGISKPFKRPKHQTSKNSETLFLTLFPSFTLPSQSWCKVAASPTQPTNRRGSQSPQRLV